ncbi:MAG: DUF5671 domain-containing protein [Dehalococcoidia bacterium]|nr:DUF5671 domain-containing protein [Dehalococcoidia bacterium]
MIFGILSSFLFLLVPAAVVAVLIALATARRQEVDADDPSAGVVARRLFVYGIGFVALIFAMVGVALLVAGALDNVFGEQVVDPRGTQLAIALAFTTVGAPAWAVMVLFSHRAMRRDPAERRSQARRWYLAAVRAVTIPIAMFNAVEAGRMSLGIHEFSGAPWGWLFASLAAWLVHEVLAQGEASESPVLALIDRLFRAYATALSLAFVLVGAALAVSVPAAAAYDGAFRSGLVAGSWTDEWIESALILAAGLGVWWWYWLRGALRRDRGTTIWRIEVFLFGILVGVLVTVVASGTALYTVLEWFLGDPSAAEASEHFAGMPARLAAVLVGIASWTYHRMVLVEGIERGAARSEPERIYRYVLSASGLAALAAGVATLLALLIEVLTAVDSGLVSHEGWWRNTLTVAITLLVVGGPLWAIAWMRLQRAVAADAAREVRSTSRRIYLLAIFGVAALILLVDLTIVLFQLFEAVLDSGVTRDVLRDARWPLALVVTAGVVAVYHWLVLREDQAVRGDEPETPAVPAMRARDVIVLGSAAEVSAVRQALAGLEGVTVRGWTRLDAPGVPAPSTEGLHDAVAGTSHERVLVLNLDGAYRVVPYSDRG